MVGRKPQIGDIVVVEWVDAVCDTNEVHAYEASGLSQVKSWGELLAMNDEYVRVGAERLDNSGGSVTYRSVTTVPTPWVMSVLVLER